MSTLHAKTSYPSFNPLPYQQDIIAIIRKIQLTRAQTGAALLAAGSSHTGRRRAHGHIDDANDQLLLTAILSALVTAPALAAKKDKPEEPAGPPPPIESIKGDEYRMAKRKMADRVTRLADAGGDPALRRRHPRGRAPPWSDISAVYVAPSRMPSKLRTKMAIDFPPGVARAFYGDEADWKTDDRLLRGCQDGREAAGGRRRAAGGGRPRRQRGRPPCRSGRSSTPASGSSASSSAASSATVRTRPAPPTSVTAQPGASHRVLQHRLGCLRFLRSPSARPGTCSCPVRDTDLPSRQRAQQHRGRPVIDRLELPGGGHFIDLPTPPVAAGPEGRPAAARMPLARDASARRPSELKRSRGHAHPLHRRRGCTDPATDAAMLRSLPRSERSRCC